MNRILFSLFNRLMNQYKNQKYQNFRKKYNIHETFRFNGNEIKFYGEGKLEIDEGSYIGGLSTIQLHKDRKVIIGKGCSISHNVRMYTSSLIPDHDFKDKINVPIKKGDIVIGNYVWIGANVFINPGVNIGENSVIGANSVVTKNIDPNSIYGGVPAKLIRRKR